MPALKRRPAFSRPTHWHSASERVLWRLRGTAPHAVPIVSIVRCTMATAAEGLELRVYHDSDLLHAQMFASQPSLNLCATDWCRQFELKGWRLER
jgi:hypothetical protein